MIEAEDDELKVMDLREMVLDREPYKGKLTHVTFRADGHTIIAHLNNLTLSIMRQGHEVYYVDLEQCTTSAQLLDRIFQIAGKTWVSPTLMGLIIKALDTCLYPQATLCSCGMDSTIEPSEIKKLVKSRMREAVAWKDSYEREGIEITWR